MESFSCGIWSALGSNEEERARTLIADLEEYEGQFTLLEPHPEATGSVHDFQGITFTKTLQNFVRDYLDRNGEYQ